MFLLTSKKFIFLNTRW